jgi:hypothetical protein
MVSKTNMVIAFFVAAVLAGLFVTFGPKSVPMPAREGFMQKAAGAPVTGGGMGPYDQVSVTGASGWMATEPAPVGGLLAGQAHDNKLMFLVDNKVSSDCCPSAFTTDTGCVCLTEQDRTLMAARGGNKA